MATFVPTPVSARPATLGAMTTTDQLAAVARNHLTEADAATWISLLRPGIRLVPHDGAAPVAARLGGVPRLPADAEWPEWVGYGPLGFIASVDCAAVAEAGPLDIAWPKAGTLLFFHYNQDDGFVVIDDPDTQAGARVVYVPADVQTAERPAPEEVEELPEVLLRAEPAATVPGDYHRAVRDAFPVDADESRRFARRPVNDRRFTRALAEVLDPPEGWHQIGGWAADLQGDVETEAAIVALGGTPTAEQMAEEIAEEATRWVLLAQFDTDESAYLQWGESGMGFWLIRPDDLAAGRFDRAVFTLQN